MVCAGLILDNSGQILGWQGFVAVDGTTYNWMGAAPGPANAEQISAEYTSTKTIFTFNVAGKVTLTATFLSPVYADDLSKQSQQFSYVSLKAKSSDGASHSVQVYTDVSGGEFLSGDDTLGESSGTDETPRVGKRRPVASCQLGLWHRRWCLLPQVLPCQPSAVY